MKNLKVKELKELIKDLDNEQVIKFYVWDYEYNEKEPYEVGIAKFRDIDREHGDLYLNVGIHY